MALRCYCIRVLPLLPCPSKVRYVGLGSDVDADVRSLTTEMTKREFVGAGSDVTASAASVSCPAAVVAGRFGGNMVEVFRVEDEPRPMMDCKFCSKSAKDASL